MAFAARHLECAVLCVKSQPSANTGRCAAAHREPFKLVSLMELLRFEADAYCRLTGMIGQLLTHFQIVSNPQAALAGMTLKDSVYDGLGATLVEMQQQLEKLNLPSAQKHFERMKWTFFNNEATVTGDWLAHNLSELLSRIVDELGERLFLNVPPTQAELYLQSKPLFGEEVIRVFPQMVEDISEAGKCLALDRSTGCVFHLMRVMELAVQRFGDELGVALAAEQNWQVILDQVNAAIRKLNPRDKKTKAYAEAASHLYNVKVAWRNEVMHPKQTYTFGEAQAIFENVKTFTASLAGIL